MNAVRGRRRRSERCCRPPLLLSAHDPGSVAVLSSGIDAAGRGGQVMQKKSAQLFDGDDEVNNVDSPHLKVNDAFARRLQVSSICSWCAPVLVS
jgi:hypothetical protein